MLVSLKQSRDEVYNIIMKIYIIVDNVRSAYNVGSIFRTADGAGSCEILLCGISPTPEHLKVQKTALGAHNSVSWKYFKTTKFAIEYLKEKKIPILALETEKKAKHFQKFKYPNELGIIVGHETEGISKDTLSQCDDVIYIPMRGTKNSLNVANATSIILYEITKEND